LIAPILHTLELDENVELAQNERLVNLGQLVVNHLRSKKSVYDENDEALSELNQFSLKNYKDLFWINKTSSFVREKAGEARTAPTARSDTNS
jgi:hypothetical protein